MEERRRYQVTTHLGAGFFQNLSAGYFFALALSPNPLALTNNLIFCILTLYVAYVLEQLSHNE